MFWKWEYFLFKERLNIRLPSFAIFFMKSITCIVLYFLQNKIKFCISFHARIYIYNVCSINHSLWMISGKLKHNCIWAQSTDFYLRQPVNQVARKIQRKKEEDKDETFKLMPSSRRNQIHYRIFILKITDMRIVAGTAGTPEEPKWSKWGTSWAIIYAYLSRKYSAPIHATLTPCIGLIFVRIQPN